MQFTKNGSPPVPKNTVGPGDTVPSAHTVTPTAGSPLPGQIGYTTERLVSPEMANTQEHRNKNRHIDEEIGDHYRHGRREQGFALLYKTYAGYVFSIAQGRVGSYLDAEEVRNDAMLELEQRLVQELTSESPWPLGVLACVIASREGVSRYRKNKVRSFKPGTTPVNVSGPTGGPAIPVVHTGPFQSADEQSALKQCLERLKAEVLPRSYDAFRLYHEGYDSKEIMEITGYRGGFQNAVEENHRRLRECLETQDIFERQRRIHTRAKRRPGDDQGSNE